MRSNLEELLQELSDLRTLVSSLAPVNAVLAAHTDSIVRDYLTIRRRFDYAAFIVGLYASFEKFVENLIVAYARLIAARLMYSELPKSLLTKHMVKSAELLARGGLGEGRHAGVHKSDVVKNLHECLSGTTPYTLNTVAIVSHDMNLRYSEINGLFSAVGIEAVCQRALKTDAMAEWYCRVNGLDEPPADGAPVVSVEPKIQNLVERRNQVAHRGGSPDDLLGADEMRDFVDFIESFARALFTIAVSAYLRHRYVRLDELAPLTLTEGPYVNRRVVVVKKPEKPLAIGQPAFLFSEVAGVRWGRIHELRANGAIVKRVDETVETPDVGIQVNIECPNGTELYVLQSEDDVVWDPLQPADTGVAAAAELETKIEHKNSGEPEANAEPKAKVEPEDRGEPDVEAEPTAKAAAARIVVDSSVTEK